ncbi:MAG: YiiX family permuted papain-like enzyme [Pseudomonadota bacterium]
MLSVMRITALAFVLLGWSFLLSVCAEDYGYVPLNGDIIFHTSRSSQSKAIQLATDSVYSHMGIVYVREGAPYVYEAVQPVKSTPLEEWIARGENGHFVVKRLKEAQEVLDQAKFDAMWSIGQTMVGKDYDLYFEWSDDRIYCSELVWKMYKLGAGIELGSLERIESFDFSHELVQAKIRERYPDGLPENEPVISPEAIFQSSQLETAYER